MNKTVNIPQFRKSTVSKLSRILVSYSKKEKKKSIELKVITPNKVWYHHQDPIQTKFSGSDLNQNFQAKTSLSVTEGERGLWPLSDACLCLQKFSSPVPNFPNFLVFILETQSLEH